MRESLSVNAERLFLHKMSPKKHVAFVLLSTINKAVHKEVGR